MGANAENRRMVEERPEGGFRFITIGQLLAIWRAYREGDVSAMALRVYFAAHEMAERRHAARASGGGEGAPTFTVEELRSLVGNHSERVLRTAVRELEREELLVLRRSRVHFAVSTDAGEELRERYVPKRSSGSRVPVPRHIVQYLAAGLGRSDVATLLAHQVRGLFRKRGPGGEWLCHSGGACKASWVAEAFGVDARSVKRSRKRLETIGLLLPVATDHWHRQRFGGWFIVNLHWSKPVERAPGEVREVSPRALRNRARLSPPDSSNSELLAEIKQDQQPASRRPAGALSDSRSSPPKLRNVKPEDLRDTGRAIALHTEACRRAGPVYNRAGRPVDSAGRLVEDARRAALAPLADPSEAGLLAFLALIEHARAHGDDPVRHFMGNLLRRRWHHVTQADEDAAVARLKRFREPRLRLRRRAERATAAQITRTAWLAMDEVERAQWKLEQHRAQVGA